VARACSELSWCLNKHRGKFAFLTLPYTNQTYVSNAVDVYSGRAEFDSLPGYRVS
jgi:hypothetical protein